MARHHSTKWLKIFGIFALGLVSGMCTTTFLLFHIKQELWTKAHIVMANLGQWEGSLLHTSSKETPSGNASLLKLKSGKTVDSKIVSTRSSPPLLQSKGGKPDGSQVLAIKLSPPLKQSKGGKPGESKVLPIKSSPPLVPSKEGQPDCQPLHFSLEHHLPRTALLSFPGSGNTWVRHLLQQATGIYTGSVYIDRRLVESGFQGENVTNSSVLVIKTHRVIDDFDKAIVLIRNPRDAIQADFQRMRTNKHTLRLPFKAFNTTDWIKSSLAYMAAWKYLFKYILRYQKSMLAVCYEDLKSNTKFELNRMLRFLNRTVTGNQMQCALANSEGKNKRKPKDSTQDVYTKDLYKELQIYLTIILKQLNESKQPAINKIAQCLSGYLKQTQNYLEKL